MISTRKIFILDILFVTMIGYVLIENVGSSQDLSLTQMENARGSNMGAGRCTASCGVANQSDFCAFSDGDACTRQCQNAATLTNYIDQVRLACPADPAPGIKYDTLFSGRCGLMGSGTCLNDNCINVVYDDHLSCGPNIIISQ